MTKPRLTRQEYNWLRAGRKQARLAAKRAAVEAAALEVFKRALDGISVPRTRSNAIRLALARGDVVAVDGRIVPGTAP